MSHRDKPWQGVVANTLNSYREGAVGFIFGYRHHFIQFSRLPS